MRGHVSGIFAGGRQCPNSFDHPHLHLHLFLFDITHCFGASVTFELLYIIIQLINVGTRISPSSGTTVTTGSMIASSKRYGSLHLRIQSFMLNETVSSMAQTTGSKNES